MTDKQAILNLKHGEHYIVPESDYGKAEIWRIHDNYLLFEIPTYGGTPIFFCSYSPWSINGMIKRYEGWT